MTKFIPIHGIKITNSITVPLKIKHIYNEEYVYYDEVGFWTYKEFSDFVSKNDSAIINADEINECDIIATYSSQSHNTVEVFNIKILISIFYFAKRLSDTYGLKEDYVRDFMIRNNDIVSELNYDNVIRMANREYDKYEDEFFENYTLKGYWTNEDYISQDRWYVKLGNNKVSKDDFDRSITRGFSSMLCDEYDRQAKFRPEIIEIETGDIFINGLNRVLKKINDEDEYSKKLKSVFRLYYDVLEERNIDNLIISYTTILEALLLKKSESKSQKIRVAVRSACLVQDGKRKEKKIFIANIISHLYTYRNQIVHEGKTFLEIDNEVVLDRVLTATKHVIYFIIKYIIIKDVKLVNEVIKVVENNIASDGVAEGNDYITYEKGKPIHIIYDL